MLIEQLMPKLCLSLRYSACRLVSFFNQDLEKGIVESGATERALELIMIELQKDNGDEVS